MNNFDYFNLLKLKYMLFKVKISVPFVRVDLMLIVAIIPMPFDLFMPCNSQIQVPVWPISGAN